MTKTSYDNVNVNSLLWTLLLSGDKVLPQNGVRPECIIKLPRGIDIDVDVDLKTAGKGEPLWKSAVTVKGIDFGWILPESSEGKSIFMQSVLENAYPRSSDTGIQLLADLTDHLIDGTEKVAATRMEHFLKELLEHMPAVSNTLPSLTTKEKDNVSLLCRGVLSGESSLTEAGRNHAFYAVTDSQQWVMSTPHYSVIITGNPHAPYGDPIARSVEVTRDPRIRKLVEITAELQKKTKNLQGEFDQAIQQIN